MAYVLRFSILSFVQDASGLQFDGYAAFTFEIHIVQQLCLHVACSDSVGGFQQSICQCGLACCQSVQVGKGEVCKGNREQEEVGDPP